MVKKALKKTIEIELPKDKEARRYVEIVIENHIGVLLSVKKVSGRDYVVVAPYTTK